MTVGLILMILGFGKSAFWRNEEVGFVASVFLLQNGILMYVVGFLVVDYNNAF